MSFPTTPKKMSLADLGTGDFLEAQYNPVKLKRKIQPIWNKLKVLGHSHEPLQYSNTSSVSFAFDLAFSCWDDRASPVQMAKIIDKAARFLESLCYARRGGQDIVGGSPPRILFVWPRLISLTAVIDDLEIEDTDFNVEGASIRFTAAIKLNEIRDTRLYSEDVRASGMRRM